MSTDDRDDIEPQPSSFKVGEVDRLSGFFTPVWESKRRLRAESPIPVANAASSDATGDSGAPPKRPSVPPAARPAVPPAVPKGSFVAATPPRAARPPLGERSNASDGPARAASRGVPAKASPAEPKPALAETPVAPAAVNANAVNSNAVSPQAASPRAASPQAASPRAVSPQAVSPRAVSPQASLSSAELPTALGLASLLPSEPPPAPGVETPRAEPSPALSAAAATSEAPADDAALGAVTVRPVIPMPRATGRPTPRAKTTPVPPAAGASPARRGALEPAALVHEPELRAAPPTSAPPARASWSGGEQRAARASSGGPVLHDKRSKPVDSVDTFARHRETESEREALQRAAARAAATPPDPYPIHLLRTLRRTLHLSMPLPEAVRAMIDKYRY